MVLEQEAWLRAHRERARRERIRRACWDEAFPPYTGPAWIGVAITPPLVPSGADWIGKPENETAGMRPAAPQQ